MDEKAKRALGSLQALCARREYCLSDIRRKAAERLDGDREAAEEVVSELLKDGFVDESRYASAFASEKSALTGWGPIKIRRALKAKADAKLEKLMAGKWRSLQEDPQAKLKLLRYALSRGYGYDEVQPVAERLTSGQDADGI